MSIVENSFYDHDNYGLVKVVRADGNTVLFEKQEQTISVNGTRIPSGGKQSAEAFEKEAEPSDVRAEAKAAEFNLTGVNQ